MHPILHLIRLAYSMEGIKAKDVAFLVSKEGATVFRCMAPQQHNAQRALNIARRVERQLGNEHAADVDVVASQAVCDGVAQTMHMVVVQYHSPVV